MTSEASLTRHATRMTPDEEARNSLANTGNQAGTDDFSVAGED